MFLKKKEKTVPEWLAGYRERERKFMMYVSGELQRKSRRLSHARLRMYCVVILGLLLVADVTFMLVAVGYANRHAVWTAPVVLFRQPPLLPLSTKERETGRKDYRLYVDSLKRDPVGAKFFDSLGRARPGLMDSMDRLEKMNH